MLNPSLQEPEPTEGLSAVKWHAAFYSRKLSWSKDRLKAAMLVAGNTGGGGGELASQAKKQMPNTRCEATAGEAERREESSRATKRWVLQNLMAI